MNKTRLMYISSVFSIFIILFFVYSCSKDEPIIGAKKSDTKGPNGTIIFPNGTAKGNTFGTGSNGNTFANGGTNNTYPNGTSSGNSFQGQENNCLIGTWIIASPACMEGYHLKLTFEQGGGGTALHMDEYLCQINMHKTFTWKLYNDTLKICYYDLYTYTRDTSITQFKCPCNLLHVTWMSSTNDKYLTKD